jgi:hypothetical protein
MATRRTSTLVVAATFVTAFLANGLIHRGLIEMRAWQQTGPLAWATFSKHADLTFPALVIYPLEAFLGAILSVAVAVSFRLDGGQPQSARLPAYGAVLMTIGGLLATTKAAPVMLGVPTLDDNVPALQQALDSFWFWGNIRGLCQMLAFVANVWSMAVMLGHRSPGVATHTQARTDA